jgi:hypothetical protein
MVVTAAIGAASLLNHTPFANYPVYFLKIIPKLDYPLPLKKGAKTAPLNSQFV